MVFISTHNIICYLVICNVLIKKNLMKKIYKILTVVGTRPEIIKLSSVIKKFEKYFNHVLVHTGQNYDYTLNQVFFKEFNLKKTELLKCAGKTSIQTISKVISNSEKIFIKRKARCCSSLWRYKFVSLSYFS